MGARSFNLLILLAMAVALAGFRTGSVEHHVNAENGEHVHIHDHSSDFGVDSHAHHHQHSDGDDKDSEDHHSDLDQLPDVLKIHWIGPRRVDLNAPPAPQSQPTAVFISCGDSEPTQRAMPPPRSFAHAQHLNTIRTIILRL